MTKGYVVCTQLYYKIDADSEEAALSALEDIHNYELYWLNDAGLTQELKALGHDIIKAKYIGGKREVCNITEED